MEDRDHPVGERADIDAELGRTGVYFTAVADMQVIVDGRAAGIDAHVSRIDRLEPLFFCVSVL